MDGCRKDTVIRMNDALAANWSGNEERIECCCLTHARRKFAELEKFYPEACGYVLDRIGEIYQIDAATKGMSDEERLAHHQKYSGPMMCELKQWMDQELKEKRVEPNSSLGKAISYFQNNYEKLTTYGTFGCQLLFRYGCAGRAFGRRLDFQPRGVEFQNPMDERERITPGHHQGSAPEFIGNWFTDIFAVCPPVSEAGLQFKPFSTD